MEQEWSTAARSRSTDLHLSVARAAIVIFDLPARRATVAAAMFLGALNGGVEAWAVGELRRREVEDAAVAVALHLAASPDSH